MTLRSEREAAFLRDLEKEMQWSTLQLALIAQLLVRGWLPSSSYLWNGMMLVMLLLSVRALWRGLQPAPAMAPPRRLSLTFLAFFPLSVVCFTVACLVSWTGTPQDGWVEPLVWGLLLLLIGVYWWRRTWRLSRSSVPWQRQESDHAATEDGDGLPAKQQLGDS